MIENGYDVVYDTQYAMLAIWLHFMINTFQEAFNTDSSFGTDTFHLYVGLLTLQPEALNNLFLSILLVLQIGNEGMIHDIYENPIPIHPLRETHQ